MIYILMASYLSSEKRCEFAVDAVNSILRSINNSGKECRLLISYSVADGIEDVYEGMLSGLITTFDFTDELDPYIEGQTLSPCQIGALNFSNRTLRFCNDKNVPIFLHKHKERRYQFEHYLYLSEYIGDNDIVCFCDDDDLYTSDKLKVISSRFTHFVDAMNHGALRFGWLNPVKIGYDDVMDNLLSDHVIRNEYYCYVVRGKYLKAFFRTDIGNGLRENILDDINCGYCDIAFAHWLNRKELKKEKIDDVLAYLRTQPCQKDYYPTNRNYTKLIV